ncbi:MAG: hypothetical protein JWQ95_6734 [Sphaerisporangium sp.]|jgi:hypothetical protein|nr:hypothetical protein [Sphaerisporangium sp.]
MNDDRMIRALLMEAPPSAEVIAEGRRRMYSGVATPSPRRLRWGTASVLAGGLVLAVTAGIVVVDTHQQNPRPVPTFASQPVSAVEVLVRASDNAGRFPELHPKPGQFLVYESLSMNPVEGGTEGGTYYRYLARSKRTVWLPVSGSPVDGVVVEEMLPSRPYPGWPLPAVAKGPLTKTGPEKLVDFDETPEDARTDYAHLSRLPTDTAGMRRYLFKPLDDTRNPYYDAWNQVINLLREAYLPAAQRAALFRAAATIPGVTSIKESTDAAGRKGVAAAMVFKEEGIRKEYIFDPKTYQFLGERSVVVDAAKAKAPVGSVLTSTAQLKVSVADIAPPLN